MIRLDAAKLMPKNTERGLSYRPIHVVHVVTDSIQSGLTTTTDFHQSPIKQLRWLVIAHWLDAHLHVIRWQLYYLHVHTCIYHVINQLRNTAKSNDQLTEIINHLIILILQPYQCIHIRCTIALWLKITFYTAICNTTTNIQEVLCCLKHDTHTSRIYWVRKFTESLQWATNQLWSLLSTLVKAVRE